MDTEKVVIGLVVYGFMNMFYNDILNALLPAILPAVIFMTMVLATTSILHNCTILLTKHASSLLLAPTSILLYTIFIIEFVGSSILFVIFMYIAISAYAVIFDDDPVLAYNDDTLVYVIVNVLLPYATSSIFAYVLYTFIYIVPEYGDVVDGFVMFYNVSVV